MPDPNTPEEWMMLVQRHERVARAMANDKVAAAEGHWHAGLAVECALKACIMQRERLNGWPSKDARPELYTHNLRALVGIAGIRPGPRDPEATSWYVVLQWDRNQGYDPKSMPRRFAQGMIEAAFGERGAVTWIRSNLT
jgi:hypothetical protein